MIALTAVLACVDAQAGRDAQTTANGAVSPQNAEGLAAEPRLPYYLDPAQDCGFLEVELFPEPVALVRHYVTLDHDASFLQSTPAMDSVYACPGHLPGPDEFTVVSGSSIEPLVIVDSMAQILVRSTQLGRMTQDSLGLVFSRAPGVAIDTFVVVNTAFGWRIESPQLPNRVLSVAVLSRPERFNLRHSVRDSLEAATSRPDT